jgi:hypothetical protein
LVKLIGYWKPDQPFAFGPGFDLARDHSFLDDVFLKLGPGTHDLGFPPGRLNKAPHILWFLCLTYNFAFATFNSPKRAFLSDTGGNSEIAEPWSDCIGGLVSEINGGNCGKSSR